MRVPVTTLVTAAAAVLLLSACATRPQVAHEGDLGVLKGQAVAAETGLATPAGTDTALAKAIQDRVAGQIGAATGGTPRYRLQVAVATSPAEVGVSTGIGKDVGVAPWRSAPIQRHFWNRRGPARTATLAVLDLSTGKVVAWASVRSSSANAVDLGDRLLAALAPAKG